MMHVRGPVPSRSDSRLRARSRPAPLDQAGPGDRPGPLPNESCARSVEIVYTGQHGTARWVRNQRAKRTGRDPANPLPLRSLPDRPGAKGFAMSDDGRIPDRRDVQLLHDHIANLLAQISLLRDNDPVWGDLWLKDDLDMIQGIATGKYWEPPRDGGAPETRPRGWPPSVCQTLFRVGQLAAELMKSWRWRPGKNEYQTQTLVVGQAVIDVLEWAKGVFSEAIEDASREDELRDRDAFICDQRSKGRSRKEIKATVNEMAAAKGWRPLRSDQAISQVVRRVTSPTRPKPQSQK